MKVSNNMKSVDKKLFRLFINWYNDNIGEVTSEIMTVADRVVYRNETELIGYVNVYMENTYHIKDKYYSLMLDQ